MSGINVLISLKTRLYNNLMQLIISETCYEYKNDL